MPDVPPEKDQSLEDWSQNFDTRITTTPTLFNLLASDATAFHALVQDFITRRAAAVNPGTRGKSTVAAKQTSKIALLARARQLARIVSAYPPVTPQQRVDLGLNVRDTDPTPIPPPATKPILALDPDGALRLVDETMPDRRGKPAGVAGAAVYMKVAAPGDPAPASVEDAKFTLLTSRPRCPLPVPPYSNGKTLYVFARWYNARGEMGPVGPMASTSIAA